MRCSEAAAWLEAQQAGALASPGEALAPYGWLAKKQQKKEANKISLATQKAREIC